MRPLAPYYFSRRKTLLTLLGLCISTLDQRHVIAQDATPIRIQLDQQALNTIPGDERAGLEVTEDKSSSAEALKESSPPGKAFPIIFIVIGVLSVPSIWAAVQEMLRRHEYGGVVIDTRTSPASIHHDQSLQADLVLVIRADGTAETVRSTLATEDFLKGVLSRQGG